MPGEQNTSQTDALDLSAVPGLPRIYMDYVLDFDRVRDLYGRDYREAGSLSAGSGPRRTGLADREEVKEILRRQSKLYASDQTVQENIEILGEGGCAVVTGQQIGLFCGPLYTIYKAATAVRLAGELSSRGSRKHVPVFWMECEDHDILEVGRVRVLDREHEISTLTTYPGPARRPTGSYLVDEHVDELLASLGEALTGSRFLDYALSMLRVTYKRGESLSLAFSRLLSEVFKGKGLIVVDPSDPQLKRIASPVFVEAVLKWKDLNEAIVRSSKKLTDMGYEPQIKVRDERPLFFLLRDGERVGLSSDDGAFRDPSRERITEAELVSLAEEEPHLFSPNVSLRPLVQDYLLQTDAYVAGPSEISYLAQIAPLYEILGLDMPAVFPRSQFTLVEPVVRRITERLGAGVGDFVGEEKEITERFLSDAGALAGLEVLGNARSELAKVMDRLSGELVSHDAEMAGPLDTYRKKTDYQLQRLEEKLKAVLKRKNETYTRQIRTAHNHLFPLDRPQERVLGTCYFMAQSGEDLARIILTNLDPFDFRHHTLNV